MGILQASSKPEVMTAMVGSLDEQHELQGLEQAATLAVQMNASSAWLKVEIVGRGKKYGGQATIDLASLLKVDRVNAWRYGTVYETFPTDEDRD